MKTQQFIDPNKTQQMPVYEDAEERDLLIQNVKLTSITGSVYEIYSKNLLGIGGEAIVYYAINEDGKKYIAKIYDNVLADTSEKIRRINKKREEARNRFLEFNKSQSYKETHLMPILDSGDISYLTALGDKKEAHVDILPVCEKVKSATYLELKNYIIPQINTALHTLHNKNYIHRDVKPDNIFKYENGVYLLGDFGTICEISEANTYDGYTQTVTHRGTKGYTAYEVMEGAATSKSDYFSFGCTIATLFNDGEYVYDINTKVSLLELIRTNGLPLKCKENEKHLQKLVDSLIVADYTHRAGYDEVIRWLKSPEDYSFELYRGDFSYEFNNNNYSSLQELAFAMSYNWEKAKAHIYRKQLSNGMSRNNLNSLSIQITEIEESHEAKTNEDLCVAKILTLLAPESPIFWKGLHFENMNSLSLSMKEGTISKQDAIHLINSGFLSWKYAKSFESTTLKTLSDIEKLTNDYPELGFELASQLFSGKQVTYNGLETIDELFTSLSKPKYYICAKIDELMNDNNLITFIASFIGVDKIYEIKKGYCNNTIYNIDSFYRLIELKCNNKTPIREHYINYGPYGNAVWVKNHIDLYFFNTAEAKRIKENICKVTYNNTDSISELSKKLSSLKMYVSALDKCFTDNILLVSLGITTEGSTISSKNSDAYFIEEFLGENITKGYYRSLNLNN